MIILLRAVNVKSINIWCLCKFQKGVILSRQSLLGLYEMLRTNYNLEYIMTQRLNQDCLEHFFGCIRQISGAQDHPDAVNFKYRLKKLLLGRETVLVNNKPNSSTNNENCDNVFCDLISSKTVYENDKHKEFELALEFCLTSHLFKNLDFDFDDGSAESVIEETDKE